MSKPLHVICSLQNIHPVEKINGFLSFLRLTLIGALSTGTSVAADNILFVARDEISVDLAYMLLKIRDSAVIADVRNTTQYDHNIMTLKYSI